MPFKKGVIYLSRRFLPCETVPNRFHRKKRSLPVFLWFCKNLNNKRINCPEEMQITGDLPVKTDRNCWFLGGSNHLLLFFGSININRGFKIFGKLEIIHLICKMLKSRFLWEQVVEWSLYFWDFSFNLKKLLMDYRPFPIKVRSRIEFASYYLEKLYLDVQHWEVRYAENAGKEILLWCDERLRPEQPVSVSGDCFSKRRASFMIID